MHSIITKPCQQFGHLGHVSLIVAAAHANQVEFQQFPRQIFIQSAPAFQPLRRAWSKRAGLFQIEQHHRMHDHGLHHIGKAPSHMGANGIGDIGRHQMTLVKAAPDHGEMVGPE